MSENPTKRITKFTKPVTRMLAIDIPESPAGPAIQGDAAVTIGTDGVTLRLKGKRRCVTLPYRDLIVHGKTADTRRTPNNRKFILGQ